MKKNVSKKSRKKVIFIFANFFFKIHFGHFFMSNFKNKKKVLKSWILSLFSPFFYFKKLLFIPRKSIFRVFFIKFAFFWGTFDKFAFFRSFFDIFILKNISFIPRKSIFHVFFMEIAFWGELLIIHHFLILIYFILINVLSFFILLIKKSV